jgi:peptide/nickel transport system substrate-binding protein
VGYHPEDAVQLMSDAGWGSGFDLNIYVTNNQARIDLATMLQAYWAALGVNLTINIGEWGTFSDAVCSGNADVYAMSWSWYPDPYFFLNNLFASNQTSAIGNGAGYVNDEVDELLQLAVETNDQDERAAYYQQVVQIAMEDVVGVYYAVPNLFYAVNPRVNDFVQRPDGTLRFVTPERNTWVA